VRARQARRDERSVGTIHVSAEQGGRRAIVSRSRSLLTLAPRTDARHAVNYSQNAPPPPPPPPSFHVNRLDNIHQHHQHHAPTGVDRPTAHDRPSRRSDNAAVCGRASVARSTPLPP